VRDATPEKKSKQKETAEASEASDLESMKIDVTSLTEPQVEDLPAAPPKQRVVRPAMTDEEEHSEAKGMGKNKGKKPAGKSKATTRNNGADQIRGRNIPKSVFPSLSAPILSHVFTNVERNHPFLLLP
jgi:hypothetical protein